MVDQDAPACRARVTAAARVASAVMAWWWAVVTQPRTSNAGPGWERDRGVALAEGRAGRVAGRAQDDLTELDARGQGAGRSQGGVVGVIANLRLFEPAQVDRRPQKLRTVTKKFSDRTPLPGPRTRPSRVTVGLSKPYKPALRS